MPLEDKDIFAAIFNKYSDQPIEFVMEQYEKAKTINSEIEKRLDDKNQETAPPSIEIIEDVVAEEPEPKKKYTRRSLKVKPEDAITEDAIFCCICGEEHQILTDKHLSRHGITTADYKKLCRYPAAQPLMSGKRLAQSREIIKHAQNVRLAKKETNKAE